MDKANMSHYKALIRAIKHFIGTQNYFYQMKPDRNINGPCELCSYSDMDYVGDNDTQKE